MDRLKNKVAIITGGASGIGEATARLFAGEGANVVIADINAGAAAQVAADIGSPAVAFHLDVTSAQDWQRCIDTAVSTFGCVDILVNNAGVGTGGSIIHEPLEGHLRTMEVNVHGVWLGMRAVLPGMFSRESGSIVNISSIDGLVGVAQLPTYTASKFAVTGLTKSVALEAGPKGVRVNSIHPGFIATPMFNKPRAGKDNRYREAIAHQPISRPGKPEEVAKAILFFASDDSSFCTGSSLVVDGGHTAGPYRIPLE